MDNISLNDHVVDGKAAKSNKSTKLKSLFEIRRPKKKELQRTNSLPAQPMTTKLDKDEGLYKHRTIPRNNTKIVRPHSCVDDENHSTKLHSVTEENRQESDLEVNLTEDQAQYVTVDLDKYETECELTCDNLSDNDMPLIINNEHTLNSHSNDIEQEHTMESIQHFLALPKAKSCMTLSNPNEDSNVDYLGKSFFQRVNYEASCSTLSCNNADNLPFWLTNKSFIHKTQTQDEETSSQISEKSSDDFEKFIDNFETSNKNTECMDKDESSKTVTNKKYLFAKNNESRGSGSRNKVQRRRTGILMKEKSVKEIAGVFEGFRDANNNGETENYRKSFIEEMDRENDRMLKDGFDSNLYLSMENLNIEDEKYYVFEEFEGIADKETEANHATLSTYKSDIEFKSDMFGKMAFNDDIEDGLYFVEAYNKDDEELVICRLQLEKMTARFNFNKDNFFNKGDFLNKIESEHVLLVNDGSESNESKRSTIYSTTSAESLEYYINGGKKEDDDSLTNKRRETITDDKGIVRIERVNYYDNHMNDEPSPSHLKDSENNICQVEESPINNMNFDYNELEHQIVIGAPIPKKTEIQYILEEILVTERKYVEGLEHVLMDYREFLYAQSPKKAKIIFGNIEEIYQLQLNFLETLERYGPQLNGITRAFIDYEMLFQLYPKYMKNVPKANATVRYLNDVIKVRQAELNQKLGISAYLVTPVQRLGKYTLFFENIIKKLNKEQLPTGEAEFALSIVKKYMRKGNDAVVIGSIEKSPIQAKYYGSFIMNEQFTLLKPKRLDSTVFLFEQVIVFTYEDQNYMDSFIFYKAIFTNDLRIATFDDNNQIHLTDFNKEKRYRTKYTFVLDAKNAKIKETWKREIENILWNQLYKVKAKTIADYSKKGQSLPRNFKRKDESNKSVKADTDSKKTTLIGNSTFYRST